MLDIKKGTIKRFSNQELHINFVSGTKDLNDHEVWYNNNNNNNNNCFQSKYFEWEYQVLERKLLYSQVPFGVGFVSLFF